MTNQPQDSEPTSERQAHGMFCICYTCVKLKGGADDRVKGNPDGLREQIAEALRTGYHGIAETKVINKIMGLSEAHTNAILEELYAKRQLVIVDENTSIFMIKANYIKEVRAILKEARK